MASQITRLAVVYSTVYSRRNHQSSTPLTFVRGIHRCPVNSLHKGPVTRKMFPFDDIIMCKSWCIRGSMSNSWEDLFTHWGRDNKATHNFADIFKCIFLNNNVWISIAISLKFYPKGLIKDIPALVQIMAWCRPRDKPLKVRLSTHICVTRLQWVCIAMNIW